MRICNSKTSKLWLDFRRQNPIFFCFLMSLRQLNGFGIKNHIPGLKSYASSKPTCFFWLIIWLMAEHNITYRRISHPAAFVVGWLVLRRNKYPCNITMAWRYASIRHGNLVFSKLHLLAEQGQFCLICIFKFQIKAAKLNCLKKCNLVQFPYSLLPSTFLSWGYKNKVFIGRFLYI